MRAPTIYLPPSRCAAPVPALTTYPLEPVQKKDKILGR